MIEILPIRLLIDEDSRIFGGLSVGLAKLQRVGFAVGSGIVVTAPNFKLKSILEHYDFGKKEIFEQSLTLVKKEIYSIPTPSILETEAGKHKEFFLSGEKIKSVKNLWSALLAVWLDQIKGRLWNNGFAPGITENLEPQIVIFIKKVESCGSAFFDPLQDDVEIRIKTGKLHPSNSKKISDIVLLANKKLFIPHEYEWIIDGEVKLAGIKPYTPFLNPVSVPIVSSCKASPCKARSVIKVFYDLTEGVVAEKEIDGAYIDSGKIFDLNKPNESFDEVVLKLVESAETFPDSPILFKLADKSEGMGKVRGALRLLHQKSLFEPLAAVLDFARHKKNLTNIQIVVPFVRGVNELLQMKRELAVKKFSRKKSLQIWMEVALPENIVNLDDYLVAGVDGVVLNLNELVAYLNGFDTEEGELAFYKQEVDGLLKFLEDGIKLLHKSKVPFIACGSLTLYPKVLEYLVEKGVMGVVVERFEFHSVHDLLHQVEKRMVLRRSGVYG
ncbi:MAG: putative PEP-binding protein [Candidatus Daviesbacteria bacterium]|nr:putative PEP-binding protein [Candidatus Daviesbacteria bacterium]